jgi:hypothetical protein
MNVEIETINEQKNARDYFNTLVAILDFNNIFDMKRKQVFIKKENA